MSESATALYFLAFDSACSSCSKLSQTVKELSAGRLLSVSLHDPNVATWRSEILGDKAAWEPTLFELGPDGKRAWTGRAMVWRLVGLLGPSRSWKLARAISASQQDMRAPVKNPGRRRFIAKSAGLALGLTLLGPRVVWPAAAKNGENKSIEVADAGTADRLAGAASNDAHHRLLAQHLATSGFTPVGPSTSLTLREKSQVVRSVLLTELKSDDGRTAAHYFGIESNGASSWSLASITKITSKDILVEVLDGSTGQVRVAATNTQALPPGGLAAVAAAPPSALAASGPHIEFGTPAEASFWSCLICRDLCAGLCVYGASRACVMICGFNPVCLGICAGVAALVCFGGCVFGCDHFPWWTTPFCP